MSGYSRCVHVHVHVHVHAHVHVHVAPALIWEAVAAKSDDHARARHALQYGGGFAEEVRRKYDADLFVLFTSLFELLPLACMHTPASNAPLARLPNLS